MLRDMLPQNEENEETSNYKFSTGTADDYTKLLNIIPQEKQQYDQFDEPDDNIQELDDEPAQTTTRSRVAQKTSQGTAKFVVNSSDRIISFFGNMFFDDAELSADSEEKQELTEAWSEVFPDPTKQIPPWVVALVCTLFIYGAKFQNAIKYKRAQEKIEADAVQIHQQQKELEQYKNELELLKHSKNGNN